MTVHPASSLQPAVSIIVPVHNDEDWVGQALESCLAQSLHEIEVVVVDDASTDATVSVVERYEETDPRIRLIRLETNGTAFRARRLGIEAARAPYVLFLDGDDELVPDTAATSLAIARADDADIVAFGVNVIRPNGESGGRYEASMQPRHRELFGPEILDKLFPIGETAQGQLWRYLFDRELLVNAYDALPTSLSLPRVNDLPIVFLALMNARKYVSTSKALYRYFFRRGASGHIVKTIDDYLFTASAIDSIEAIADVVFTESTERANGTNLNETYDSARLSVIGRVLEYVFETVDQELRTDSLDRLIKRVGKRSVLLACADFCAKALPMLVWTVTPARLRPDASQHIILRTGNLRTGGVQGVLVAQAAILVRAGHRVTIVVDADADSSYILPDGVELLHMQGKSRGQRVAWFVNYCLNNAVTLVIDHHILYNERWPYFSVVLADAGVAMVGWLHNFALRPIMDANDRLSFLERYLPSLTAVVVLSPADVAYWKLRGIGEVVYMPNPASPMIEGLSIEKEARTAPTDVVELVWWGRLQQSTKQVKELVHIGRILQDEGVEFRLTLIGPDSPDLSAKDIRELAIERGIDDRVAVLGERFGTELFDAIESSHIFVSTSAIEGYPLALVEAQALGLPIVMYDLPWLAFLKGNVGVVSVQQGDRRAAARAIASLTEPVTYARKSEGSLVAARSAVAHDFVELYGDFVTGSLGMEYSPAPTTSDMRLLLEQNVVFVERLIGRERRAIDRARNDARGQREKARQLNRELEEARADATGQRKKARRLSRELEEARADATGQRKKARRLSRELEEARAEADGQRKKARRLSEELGQSSVHWAVSRLWNRVRGTKAR